MEQIIDEYCTLCRMAMAISGVSQGTVVRLQQAAVSLNSLRT